MSPITTVNPTETAEVLDMMEQVQTTLNPEMLAQLEAMAAATPVVIGLLLVGALLWRVILGLVARRVTSNRGRRGGFWWGFFMGFIGIIVAAVRPKE